MKRDFEGRNFQFAVGEHDEDAGYAAFAEWLPCAEGQVPVYWAPMRRNSRHILGDVKETQPRA